jgi:glycosidase
VAVVGDLVVAARVARLDPDPQRGPGPRRRRGRGRAAVHHARRPDGLRRGRDRHGGIGDPGTRQPFPWDRLEAWDRTTFGHYRALARLRRANHALRRGGLRWVHAEGDALAFLRESERQRLLVLAARAGNGPLRLPAGPLGLAGEAPNLYGAADPCDPIPTAL